MAKSIRGGLTVLIGPALREKPPGQACVLDIALRALPSSYLAAGLNYRAQCGAWGQTERPLGAWTARSQGDSAGRIPEPELSLLPQKNLHFLHLGLEGFCAGATLSCLCAPVYPRAGLRRDRDQGWASLGWAGFIW